MAGQLARLSVTSRCVQRPPSSGSPQERDPLSAAQAQEGSASSASTTDRQQGFSRASPHSHSISKRQQPQYAIPPPAAPDATHNNGPRGPLPISLSEPKIQPLLHASCHTAMVPACCLCSRLSSVERILNKYQLRELYAYTKVLETAHTLQSGLPRRSPVHAG